MKIVKYSLLFVAFGSLIHPMDAPKPAANKGASKQPLVNETAQGMLFGAASAGNQARVEQALRDGANPGLVDNQGYNALHIAAHNGRDHIVEFLLNRHPNLLNTATTNSDGQTALHLASIGGHLRVVNILIRRPFIQAAAQDSSLRTPLHYAAVNGHMEVVKALMPALNDQEVQISDATGCTALELTLMMSQPTSPNLVSSQSRPSETYASRNTREATQLNIPNQEVKKPDDRRKNTAQFLNNLPTRTQNQVELGLYQTISQSLWGNTDASIALENAFEAVRNIYLLGQPSQELRRNLEIITALIHGIPTEGMAADMPSGSGRQNVGPVAGRANQSTSAQPQQPATPAVINRVAPAAATPKQPVSPQEASRKMIALGALLEELLGNETESTALEIYSTLIDIVATEDSTSALVASTSVLETNLRRNDLSAQLRASLNRIAGIVAPHLQTSNNEAANAALRAPQAATQANIPVEFPERFLASILAMLELQHSSSTRP
jgi:ankyrin repeat protein